MGSGAGAAALACLDLLVSLGLPTREHLRHRQQGRGLQGPHGGDGPEQGALRAGHRGAHARRDHRRRRHLPRPVGRRRAEARDGARRWRASRSSSRSPIPSPRSCRSSRRQVRPDAIIATGRSDYPNQVNNVLCFPFIFRGALDCGATTINEEMKLAAVRAIAELAQAEPSDIVAQAYGGRTPALRPRLPDPQAVRSAADRARSRRRWRKAAMDSGVATRPIADLDAYREQLTQFVYHSGMQHEAGVRGGEAARPSASSTPRARTSACCARCRSWSTKAWRGRS